MRMQTQPDEHVKCDVEEVKMYFPEVDCSKRLRMKTYVSCLGKTGKDPNPPSERKDSLHASTACRGDAVTRSQFELRLSSEVAETPKSAKKNGAEPFWC